MAEKWTNILREGAVTSELPEIMRYIQVPRNIPTICGPKLNPELKQISPEESHQDHNLRKIQTQLGKALCILTSSFNDSKDKDDLEKAIKLIADVQYKLSKHRRELFYPKLNTEVREFGEIEPIGSFLFAIESLHPLCR